ncbi:MAG: PKD domain-containing protein [bacterium]
MGKPIVGTKGDFNKPNQSRVFYHDGTWWLAAKSEDTNWYLWKQNNGTWEQGILIDKSSKSRPDCYVDEQNNTLYVGVSHTSDSRFVRAHYASGGWLIDAGFPTEIDDFRHRDEDVISLGVDKSGGVWLFRIADSTLKAVHSSDGGATWGDEITIKSNLNHKNGLTDAVAFQINGEDYIGVAYGENTANHSEFGFLRHRVGDTESDWTDETAQMGQFADTHSDNHVCAIVDAAGDIFIVTKTGGGTSSVVANGLYKRGANGWQNFAVNLGSGWTRPAISVDETNRQLYIFGTYESSPRIGVFKKVFIGEENTLATATETRIFQSQSERFKNLSVPAHTVDQNMGLMVVVENSTRDMVWYNQIEIIRSNRTPTAIASASITSGNMPLTVEFSGSNSSDPDGVIVSFAWNFGDNIGTSDLPNPQYTYKQTGTFQAKLIVTDNEGGTAADSVTIKVDSTISDVEDNLEVGLPVAFHLLEAYPNPVSQGALATGKRVNIRLGLSIPQKVSLHIYNVLGQNVASLLEDQSLPPASHNFIWNGRTHSGRLVPPGLYFIQVRARSKYTTKSVMILR